MAKAINPEFLVYRNKTKFCWIGKAPGAPETAEANPHSIDIPPGTALRKPGNILEFMLRNSQVLAVAFKGPVKAVTAELKSLGRTEKDCDAWEVDGEIVTGRFRGWHGSGSNSILEDVTAEVAGVQDAFMSDPDKVAAAARLGDVVKTKDQELASKDDIIRKLQADLEAAKAKVK